MSDTAAPLVYRRAILSGTEEATRGTQATVSAALSSTSVFNATFEPDNFFADTERRPIGASTSTMKSPLGMQKGRFSFMTQICPGDKTLPMLTACGARLATSTYYPTSNQSNRKCWSFGMFEDGRKKVVYGCAANCVIDIEGGKPVTATFEGIGIWDALTDVSLPSDSLPTALPYMGLGATLTVNSAAVATLPKMTINLGAQLAFVEDITTATGLKFAYVTDFSPRITMELDARLKATITHYDLLESATEHAIQLVLTSGANTLTIDCPKAQRINISDVERDNRRGDTLEFQLNFNSGDDWISFVEA